MEIKLVVLLSAISTIISMMAIPAAAATDRGLTVSAEGTLLRDGKPYRAIGVNYVSAFTRTLANPDDTSYIEGFKVLQQKGIPFVRMWAMGYWPVDNALYLKDRPEFYRRMDKVVKAAEKADVGIVFSMFFNHPCVSDLVGEPVNQWGNPDSKTTAFMRTFVKEMITRYGKSKAAWGWEFGNEMNLGADLPNAVEHRPQIATDLGTPASRSAEDEISHDMMRSAFKLFGAEVRKYDKTRPIFTGNAFPRQSAFHQMTEKSWRADTTHQYAIMFADDNPDPINTLSGHFYSPCLDKYGRKMSVEEFMTESMAISRKSGKPFVVGEFGTADQGTPELEKVFFQEIIDGIEKTGVPLSMMWVYDFTWQEADCNVTATNSRAYRLDIISEANKRMAQ
ncbi:MAG: cellulase family glycosylhydrolase [Armatimonadota bacterium]